MVRGLTFMDISGVASSGSAEIQPETKTSTAGAAASEFSAVLGMANQTPPGHEVVYLDGATGQSRTGYVVSGAICVDAEGTLPASDYSQFRREDGLLYIRTPYGTIRMSDYHKLLNKQQEYDLATFGAPLYGGNGQVVGTAVSANEFSAPRASYTSAPNGPGSISEYIFNTYYSAVEGSTPELTVASALSGDVSAKQAAQRAKLQQYIENTLLDREP
jgi:hypothetical protein